MRRGYGSSPTDCGLDLSERGSAGAAAGCAGATAQVPRIAGLISLRGRIYPDGPAVHLQLPQQYRPSIP